MSSERDAASPGSSVRRMPRRRCGVDRAATSVVEHPLLDRRAGAPDASRSCAGRGRAAAASAAPRRPSRRRRRSAPWPCRRSRSPSRSASAPPDAADRRGATRRRRSGRPRACTGSGRWCRSTGSRASSRNAEIASTAAGISIMPPTSTPESNGTPCSRSDSFACAIIASVWSISPTDASIGIRIRTLAVVRRAQDRAELGEEQPRLGEAEAHRAQAERRDSARRARGRRGPPSACRRRGRTCGSSPACRPCPAATLRYASNCSSSVGSPSRLRNRNSERKRPMPRGAVLERLREVVGQLDVGVELDRVPVDRRRRLGLEPAQLRALELELALLQPVLGEHRLVRD